MSWPRFTALMLLLVVWGAPLMVCLAPDAQLTEEEQACCRNMADNCGNTDMAASHSCCRKILPSQKDALIQQLAPIDNAANAAAAIAAEGAMSPELNQEFRDWPSNRHPPPDIPLRAVLRI